MLLGSKMAIHKSPQNFCFHSCFLLLLAAWNQKGESSSCLEAPGKVRRAFHWQCSAWHLFVINHLRCNVNLERLCFFFSVVSVCFQVVHHHHHLSTVTPADLQPLPHNLLHAVTQRLSDFMRDIQLAQTKVREKKTDLEKPLQKAILGLKMAIRVQSGSQHTVLNTSPSEQHGHEVGILLHNLKPCTSITEEQLQCSRWVKNPGYTAI